jgi:PAS domain-containing protein
MSLLKLGPPIQPSLLESIFDVEQTILDCLPIGVYACDSDGRILRVNRKAIELWGQAPKIYDLSQKFCGTYRLESLEGHAIPREATPMARAAQAGESFDGVEAVVYNPDGKR